MSSVSIFSANSILIRKNDQTVVGFHWQLLRTKNQELQNGWFRGNNSDLENNFAKQVQAYNFAEHINRETQPMHADFFWIRYVEFLEASDRCWAHLKN